MTVYIPFTEKTQKVRNKDIVIEPLKFSKKDIKRLKKIWKKVMEGDKQLEVS